MPLSVQGRLKVGLRVCVRGRERVFFFQDGRRGPDAVRWMQWHGLLGAGHLALVKEVQQRAHGRWCWVVQPHAAAALRQVLGVLRNCVHMGHEDCARWVLLGPTSGSALLRVEEQRCAQRRREWSVTVAWGYPLGAAVEQGWRWCVDAYMEFLQAKAAEMRYRARQAIWNSALKYVVATCVRGDGAKEALQLQLLETLAHFYREAVGAADTADEGTSPCNAVQPALSSELVPLAAASGSLRVFGWVQAHVLTEHVQEKADISLTLAAQHGRIDMCEALLASPSEGSRSLVLHPPPVATAECVTAAMRGGALDVLKYLHRTHPSAFTFDVTASAAAGTLLCRAPGALAMLEWLKDCALPSLSQQSPRAPTSGFGAGVSGGFGGGDGSNSGRGGWGGGGGFGFSRARMNPIDSLLQLSTMEAACESGHLRLVEFLHRTNPRVARESSSRALDAAAQSNHFALVKWLHRNRPQDTCSTRAVDTACVWGEPALPLVEFLLANRSEGYTRGALVSAVRSGSLHLAEFLMQHAGAPCTTWAVDEAAAAGDVRMLEVLLDEHQSNQDGEPWCSPTSMARAAFAGKLSAVQFLFFHGGKDATAASAAAFEAACGGGHLEVAKWLHENAVPGRDSFDPAAVRTLGAQIEDTDCMAVLEWMLAIRSSEVDASQLVHAAVQGGRVSIAEWLVRRFHAPTGRLAASAPDSLNPDTIVAAATFVQQSPYFADEALLHLCRRISSAEAWDAAHQAVVGQPLLCALMDRAEANAISS